MLRIGEFAVLSSISIYMLRNYDKIGLLSPQHIDESSGYRYYDKEQLVQANQIIALKTMGFSLDEIKSIILSGQPKIETIIQSKLQEKYMELDKIKEQINQIKTVMDTPNRTEEYARSIVRKKMKGMRVAYYKGQINTYPEEGMLWGRLTSICQKAQLNISVDATAMAVYYKDNEVSDKLTIEVQFPLDYENKDKGSKDMMKGDKGNHIDEKTFIKTIPEREVISVVFKGCYSQIGSINTVVAEWLEKNHLQLSGEVFSIYHNSPGNGAKENEFVTELCFPVQEISCS